MSKEKKQWRNFSPAQKATTIVAGIAQVSLLIAALWDIRRRPAEQIRGRKALWAGAAFINWVGPISYFLFGRKEPDALAASDPNAA
jgi:hypothetical protein